MRLSAIEELGQQRSKMAASNLPSLPAAYYRQQSSRLYVPRQSLRRAEHDWKTVSRNPNSAQRQKLTTKKWAML